MKMCSRSMHWSACANAIIAFRFDTSEFMAAAERNDVRVCLVAHRSGSDVERYVTLLQTGMFASVYFAVGLGRYLEL